MSINIIALKINKTHACFVHFESYWLFQAAFIASISLLALQRHFSLTSHMTSLLLTRLAFLSAYLFDLSVACDAIDFLWLTSPSHYLVLAFPCSLLTLLATLSTYLLPVLSCRLASAFLGSHLSFKFRMPEGLISQSPYFNLTLKALLFVRLYYLTCFIPSLFS